MDKPVLNAAPLKDESRTVVKSDREEDTKPIFNEKDRFERKPLLWSQQSPAESTLAKYGNLSPNTYDGILPFKE